VVAIGRPHIDCRPVVFVTDKRPSSGTTSGRRWGPESHATDRRNGIVYRWSQRLAERRRTCWPSVARRSATGTVGTTGHAESRACYPRAPGSRPSRRRPQV